MGEIEVFVEVVEANSFVRAAKRLRMPASTLSARIAGLEERLGVTLIRRSTRQVHVTAAGRSNYARCLRALAELGEAEREIAAAREEPTGLLRIAAPSEMAMFLLPRHVEAYLARHPKACVETITTDAPFDDPDRDVDLAIQLEPLPTSKFVVRPFRQARLGLWASPAYLERRGAPRSMAELAYHDLIRFTRTEGDFVVRPGTFERAVLDRASRLATDDFHSLLGFIMGGLGIGLLPDFMGENLCADLPIVPVLPELFVGAEARICFVHPAQAFVATGVAAFIAQALGGSETPCRTAHVIASE